jgi:hypothetical protein
MPEVLTVIVIVGIVSAMAVPRFMRFTATSRLEETAQILAKDMDWAKLAGTRSGDRHYVRFVPGTDSSWYEIWKENSDPVDNLFSSSDDRLLRRVAMDPAVRFGGLRRVRRLRRMRQESRCRPMVWETGLPTRIAGTTDWFLDKGAGRKSPPFAAEARRPWRLVRYTFP